MSKINNLLQGAVQARKEHASTGAGTFPGYLNALKQELLHELGWADEAAAQNGAPAAPAASTPSTSTAVSPASLLEAVAQAQRQLQESDRQLASLAAARASQAKRLEVLRECHALAQEVGRAEAELAQCQQRAKILQQRIDETRFRLAQTLSAIGGVHE